MAKLMFARVQEISHSFQIRKASHLAHVMFIPPFGNQPSSSSMILYIHFLCSTLYECNITTCKYLTWIQEAVYYYYINIGSSFILSRVESPPESPGRPSLLPSNLQCNSIPTTYASPATTLQRYQCFHT